MANVIITNLSTLKTYSPQIQEKLPFRYQSDIGVIEGEQTNDAPIKYLISMLLKEKKSVDKIIVVTTDQAKKSGYPEFCNMLEKYCKGLHITAPELKQIDTTDDTKDMAATISGIIKEIHSGDVVYFDTTGGFRNASYLLMVVIRILEYSGIEMGKATYIQFSMDEPQDPQYREIKDINEIYDFFDLINASNSFAAFGNAAELDAFFANSRTKEINDVLDAMRDFSDAVALCRTSDLDSILDRLRNGLVQLESLQTTQQNEVLFQSLSKIIRKKFNLHSTTNIDYIDIILWCINNNLIQQAVTIYTERIAKYIFDKGVITATRAEIGKMELERDRYDLYYYMFLHGVLGMEVSVMGLFFRKYDRPAIMQALADAKDVRAFSAAAHITLTPEETDTLPLFFQLKNAMFDKDGLREQSRIINSVNAIERFKRERYRQSILNVKLPKKNRRNITPMDFIDTLKKDRQRRYKFLDCIGRQRIYRNNFLYTIECLESGLRNQNAYTVHVKIDEMKAIMRDYMYIKTWLRNAINHASDENKHTREEENYFQDWGYNTDEEPELEEVVDLLTDAVENLREIAEGI